MRVPLRRPRAARSPRRCAGSTTPASAIDDIAVRRPTLDDVFLALTGHAAEEPTEDGEPRRRRRVSALGYAVSDTLVLAKRNLLRIPRQPDLLIGFTVQPIMFVLLFVYVFGGAIETPGFDYVDFLMPGIIVQTMAFGGFVTALGLAEDLQEGPDRPLPLAADVRARRCSPGARSPTSSRTCSQLAGHDRRRACIVGFSFSTRASLEVVAGIVPAAAVRLRVLVGLRVHRADAPRRPRRRSRSASSSIFPLTFASSAFVPVDSMPSWLQALRRGQPVHDHGRRDARALDRRARRATTSGARSPGRSA